MSLVYWSMGMRVNRIYFRGLKTFQCGFVFFLMLLLLPGCVNLGKVVLRTTPVAQNPPIIDIEITGPCSQACVSVQTGQGAQTKTYTQTRQVVGKQGDSPVFRARVRLDEHTQSPHGPADELELTIRCPTHSERVIHYTIEAKIFDPLSTPDWAKGLVWYQVFPERFRDGNPNNNPKSWDLTPMAWDSPFGEVSQEEIERAWNRRLVDPRKFQYDQNRAGGSVAGVVFARRYGGDLIGVYNQLESLSEQGYTGIYLCPIFQSRSLHKYDADDHRHIDPTLGHPGQYTDPGPGHTRLAPDEDPADETTWAWTVSDRWFVDVFLPKAKSLGMRVVLDGVWNHVGTDHFAFADVREHGQDSPFADWFDAEFDEQGNLFAWRGWGGSINGDLPEFKQTKAGDLAPGPKAHIMAVTRRWMDPNGDGDPSDGIDGWRLDVAAEIGKPFWKDWRKQVRAINPDALIIAEIWSDADSMLNDQAFDGQMNYPFAYAVANWLSIGHNKGDAVLCADRLTWVFHHAPEHDLVQFNLMTSHDTERLASMMHNDFQRNYDNDSSRWAHGTRYDPETIDPEDMDRALSAIAVMVASPGSLMIYNGDEYALPGADDPDNRRPIPWGSLEEGTDPDSESRIAFNRVVGELIRIRSEPWAADILRFGDVQFIGIADGPHAGSLMIRRQLGNRMIEFLIPGRVQKAADDSPWPTDWSGWRVEGERSRKYRLASTHSPILVRYLIGQ